MGTGGGEMTPSWREHPVACAHPAIILLVVPSSPPPLLPSPLPGVIPTSATRPPRGCSGPLRTTRGPQKLIAPGQLSGDNASWGHSGAGDTARSPPPPGARPGIEQGTSPPRGADGDLQLHNARSCAGPDGPQGESRAGCVCVSPPLPDPAAILPTRLQQRP